MDALDLPNILGAGGAVMLLAWIVIRVMTASSGDRKQYLEDLRADRAEHADEIKAITERYDSQIKGHTQQIVELRQEIADVRQQLEVERKARWAAEDSAAQYRRMAGVSDDE